MPGDWGAWPMPSPYELLLRIQRQLGIVEGRQETAATETRRHLESQDAALREIKDRVLAIEQRPAVHLVDPPRPEASPSLRFLLELKSFLGAVASPREWVFGGALVTMVLFGIVDPETFRRWLFAVIGLPPI